MLVEFGLLCIESEKDWLRTIKSYMAGPGCLFGIVWNKQIDGFATYADSEFSLRQRDHLSAVAKS